MVSRKQKEKANDIPQKRWQMQTTQMTKRLSKIHRAKSQQHSLEQAAKGISLFAKLDKTYFICFKQDEVITTLNGKPLSLEDQFTYLGSNISSTESNINIRIKKGVDCYWLVIDHMEIWSLQ